MTSPPSTGASNEGHGTESAPTPLSNSALSRTTLPRKPAGGAQVAVGVARVDAAAVRTFAEEAGATARLADAGSLRNR